ncbi:MAG: hypothetical protein M3082_01555 [Candidatus Dormibacteraeota bacterium]|nr:hypothetical protein [Candidatus Dormibacteraeota bacterium]
MGTPRVVSFAGRGAAAALVLAVALPTPAFAALWMKISINPSTPTAGESVSVTVLTFSATQNLCWDDPHISPIPEATWYSGGAAPIRLGLEMVVVNSSQRFTIPLVQRPADGAYWDGTIVFPSGGAWQLYAKRAGASPNPTSADRCSGLVRTVEVQPMGQAATPKTAVTRTAAYPADFPTNLMVGALLLAVAATAGLASVVISRLRR